MEMLSPDNYLKEMESLTVEQLIEEKSNLEEKIAKIEDDIVNNVPDVFLGGRDTKLKMYNEYLAKIKVLISSKQEN